MSETVIYIVAITDVILLSWAVSLLRFWGMHTF